MEYCIFIFEKSPILFICRKWGKAATSIFTCEKSFFFIYYIKCNKKTIYIKKNIHIFLFSQKMGKLLSNKYMLLVVNFFFHIWKKWKKVPIFCMQKMGKTAFSTVCYLWQIFFYIIHCRESSIRAWFRLSFCWMSVIIFTSLLIWYWWLILLS